MQETINMMNKLKENDVEYNKLLLKILLLIDNNAEENKKSR